MIVAAVLSPALLWRCHENCHQRCRLRWKKSLTPLGVGRPIDFWIRPHTIAARFAREICTNFDTKEQRDTPARSLNRRFLAQRSVVKGGTKNGRVNCLIRFFVVSLTTRSEPYNRTAIHAETDFVQTWCSNFDDAGHANVVGRFILEELTHTVRLPCVNSELLINAPTTD